jgi:hypothetical protein
MPSSQISAQLTDGREPSFSSTFYRHTHT